MSETDPGTATVEAPPSGTPPDSGELPPVPAPEKLETPPAKPLSRREAKQGVYEQTRKRLESVQTPKASEPPAPEPTATEPEPSGEPAAPEPTEAPQAAPITVEVPADHPATRGRQIAIPVQTEQEADVIRALVNGTYVRRGEISAKDRRIAELTEQLARREAKATAQERWKQTPEYQNAQARYQRLRELEGNGDVPEGTADEYWNSTFAQGFQQLESEEFEQRMAQYREQEQAQAAEAFANQAWHDASRLPEHIRSLPDFQQWFNRALTSFNAELGLGHYDHVKPGDVDALHREFRRFFQANLVREPAVLAAERANKVRHDEMSKAAADQAAAQEREREAIKAAAIKEFQQSAAARRRDGPPHPLGSLPGAPRPPESSDPGESPPQGTAPQTVHELRRSQKRAAREDARRRFGLTG